MRHGTLEWPLIDSITGPEQQKKIPVLETTLQCGSSPWKPVIIDGREF